MTPNPLTIPPSATLGDALSLMMRNGVHALPVVDGRGVAGIITRSDLRAALGGSDPESSDELDTAVHDHIEAGGDIELGWPALGPESTFIDACRLLLHEHVGAAAVVDEDRSLVGILSVTDLLAEMIRRAESTEQD